MSIASLISRIEAASSRSPRRDRCSSSSTETSKWSSIARLPRPVMISSVSRPAATASSTMYWMIGRSTIGSISLGCAFVAGKKRVPRPAAGMTPLRTRSEPIDLPVLCPDVAQVGARVQARPGDAADQLGRFIAGAVAVHVFGQPAAQRVEAALADLVRQFRVLIQCLFVKLHRQDGAQAVGREIPEHVVGPVDVLEHAP